MAGTMNPEVKAQWVEALRSGEYEQGRNELQLNGRFCCLGVLCDLAVKAGVCTSREVTTDEEVSVHYGTFGSYSSLPEEVIEWAGLDTSNPPVRDTGTVRTLIDLNDYFKRDFAYIADTIEDQL